MARVLRRKNPPARTSSDGGRFHPDFSDNSPITVLKLLSARYDPDNSLAPGTPKKTQKGAKKRLNLGKKKPFPGFSGRSVIGCYRSFVRQILENLQIFTDFCPITKIKNHCFTGAQFFICVIVLSEALFLEGF